jgi:hypothetical protein
MGHLHYNASPKGNYDTQNTSFGEERVSVLRRTLRVRGSKNPPTNFVEKYSEVRYIKMRQDCIPTGRGILVGPVLFLPSIGKKWPPGIYTLPSQAAMLLASFKGGV